MSNWLGLWTLLPELSHYTAGDPPASGTYEITREDDILRFRITWTDAEGDEAETGFTAHPDGRRVTSAAPDVETFSVLAETDDILSGDAQTGSRTVGRAVRRVSSDGSLMTVLQERSFEAGKRELAYQVYRRADASRRPDPGREELR